MNERTREAKQAWSAAVEEEYQAALALKEAKERTEEGRRVLLNAEYALDEAEQAERVEAAA